MAKFSAPALSALGVFVLLLVFAPQVLQFGSVLLAVAFATALSAALVLTVIDLTGPTRTDAEGNALGLRDRWRLHVLKVRNFFLARPWRNAAAVRRAAMRAVSRVRVCRPAGSAAAEHICVSANPVTLDALDEYQAIEETAWDIGEKYRHATQGQPAAGPEVSIWVVPDPTLPRGYVRVRAALRQPIRSDVVAHATVALTPGDVMPRGAGARPASGLAIPDSVGPAMPVPASPAPAPTKPVLTKPVLTKPVLTKPVQTSPARFNKSPTGQGESVADDVAQTAPHSVAWASSAAWMQPGGGGVGGFGASAGQSAPSDVVTAVIPRPDAPASAGNAPLPSTAGSIGVGETMTLSSPVVPSDSTPTAPATSIPAAVPVAQLLDSTGEVLGQAVPLPDGTKLTVGRDPQSGILVPDAHVSRSHLQLRASGGRVWLRDLGSRGGTEVSGRRLPAGDEVEVPTGTVIGLSPQPKTGQPAVSLRIG